MDSKLAPGATIGCPAHQGLASRKNCFAAAIETMIEFDAGWGSTGSQA